MSRSTILHIVPMLNIEKFTFEDYKATPVEVTVWNRLPDTPTPVLCIDYHNVADSHPLLTLRERSGLRYEPHAIVSLLFSYGTNFDELRDYAERTGQLTVGIVFSPSKEVRKEQKQAVKGIKRRMVENLGWTTARCALDDKPTLWMPSTDVEPLRLDDVSDTRIGVSDTRIGVSDTRIGVFKIQWSGLSTEKKEEVETVDMMYSMTLVIRKDLDMRPGKVAAQCTHAALGACYQKLESKKVKAFLKDSNSRRAIVLRVNNLAELEDVNARALAAGLNTYIQVDAGLTQVPDDSSTVLAIGPDDPERIHAVTNTLKLF